MSKQKTGTAKSATMVLKAKSESIAELCGGPSGPSERAPGYASGGKD